MNYIKVSSCAVAQYLGTKGKQLRGRWRSGFTSRSGHLPPGVSAAGVSGRHNVSLCDHILNGTDSPGEEHEGSDQSLQHAEEGGGISPSTCCHH